jgi:hypothetical protein
VKIYNRYILIIASLFLLTTVILIAMEQHELEIYFILYIVEALVVTQLHVNLNPKARAGLSVINTLLFSCFIVIVISKIIGILI